MRAYQWHNSCMWNWFPGGGVAYLYGHTVLESGAETRRVITTVHRTGNQNTTCKSVFTRQSQRSTPQQPKLDDIHAEASCKGIITPSRWQQNKADNKGNYSISCAGWIFVWYKEQTAPASLHTVPSNWHFISTSSVPHLSKEEFLLKPLEKAAAVRFTAHTWLHTAHLFKSNVSCNTILKEWSARLHSEAKHNHKVTPLPISLQH